MAIDYSKFTGGGIKTNIDYSKFLAPDINTGLKTKIDPTTPAPFSQSNPNPALAPSPVHKPADVGTLKQGVVANLPSTVVETVGGFLKGLVSPFVSAGTSAYNVYRQTKEVSKALKEGKQTVPFVLGQSYNIPIYGKAEPTFTGEESPKDLTKKVIGNALEIAPYFLGAGEASSLVKTTETLGKKPITELTKQEITQFVKAYGTKLAASSLGLGTVFGIGTSLKEGATPQQTTTNIVKSIATVALLESTLSPLIKYGLGNKAEGQTAKEAVDKVIEDHKAEIDQKVAQIKANQKPVEQGNIDYSKFTQPETPSSAPISPEATPTEIPVSRSQLPVGTGETQVSTLEARVKNTLDNASPDTVEKLGLSTYEQMNKKDNIAAASDYVSKNPEDALKVLTGEKEAPQGVLRNSIYVAMQNEAVGNVDLARKLASLGSTRLGQELSILTEIDPNSPVKAMSDVIKFREATFEKQRGKSVAKAKAEVVKEINTHLENTKIEPKTWAEFIDKIKC